MRHAGQIIKKAEGKYQIRIALGTDGRGKRRFFTRTINATLTQARAYLTQKLRERDTGQIAQRNDGLLGDWMTHWLSTVCSIKVRQRTAEHYAFLANRYVLPYLGNTRVGDLNVSLIEGWLATLKQRELKLRTMRLARSVLHNAVEALVKRGELPTNVVSEVKLPRPDRAAITPLTIEQAQEFLDGIAGSPHEVLWILLLTTGMRPGEALALRWMDIQPERIHIMRSLSWTKSGPIFGDPKTPTGRRQVPIDGAEYELLRKRRKQATHTGEQDLVFCTRDGHPLDWRVLRRRYFTPMLKQLGLPRIRAYDLRHTCATILLALGISPVVVAQRLGHKNTAFLLDTYGHVLPHQQKEATERLSEALKSHRGP